MKFKLKIESAYRLASVVNSIRFLSKIHKHYDAFTIDPLRKDKALIDRFNKLSEDDKISLMKAGILLKDTMLPLLSADVCVEVETK